MIIETNQLNHLQLHQLDELNELCQKADQGAPALYRHLLVEKRPNNSALLYYKNSTADVCAASEQRHINEQLVGFLSAYFFYNHACEISVLVHPNYRHQKIATQLLQQILPLLTKKTIQRVIFSTSPSLTYLAEKGLTYQESEYRMERTDETMAPLTMPTLAVRHANMHDIPALLELDQRCFASEVNSSHDHMVGLLNNPHYTILIASYQGKSIGKAHLRRQDASTTFLSDIAILPAFQGQGMGYELIAHAINEALREEKTRLVLDVSTSPASKALNLYLRHGFKIRLQYDYWTISLDQLRSLLEP